MRLASGLGFRALSFPEGYERAIFTLSMPWMGYAASRLGKRKI